MAPNKVNKKVQKLNFPFNASAKEDPTRTGVAAIQKVLGLMKASQADRLWGVISFLLFIRQNTPQFFL